MADAKFIATAAAHLHPRARPALPRVIRIRSNVRSLTRLVAPLLTALPLLDASAQATAQATAQTTAPTAARHTPRVVDSLPGLRLQWELAPVPGGEVTVPGPNGPARVAVVPFLIGVTEVPWELYDVFYLRLDVPRDKRVGIDATTRPSRPYGAPDRGFGHRGWPTISLTHTAAVQFASWLSEKTGQRYFVATDAQWQRAADVALAGLDAAARQRLTWSAANSDGTTRVGATRDADQLGLHDLLGNAGEWVTGVDGTPWLRGGSYRTPFDSLSATTRERQQPSWNQTDPQDPKSRWWLSDGPFAGVRLVRIP